MVIAIRFCEYTKVEASCYVVAIVFNGNEDISMWFCNVRVFLMVESYFH